MRCGTGSSVTHGCRLPECATFRCTKVLFQELVRTYLLIIPSAIGYVPASRSSARPGATIFGKLSAVCALTQF